MLTNFAKEYQYQCSTDLLFDFERFAYIEKFTIDSFWLVSIHHVTWISQSKCFYVSKKAHLHQSFLHTVMVTKPAQARV